MRCCQVDAVTHNFATDSCKVIFDLIQSAKFKVYLPDIQIGSSFFKSLRDVDNQVGYFVMIRYSEKPSQVLIFGINEG